MIALALCFLVVTVVGFRVLQQNQRLIAQVRKLQRENDYLSDCRAYYRLELERLRSGSYRGEEDRPGDRPAPRPPIPMPPPSTYYE